MKFIQSLDFFTKPKEEVESSTGVGGLFSLIGLACGVLFFIIEISSFLGSTWIREMSVDNDFVTRTERVNIDIVFHKAPCALLCLTQEEEGGVPVIDIPLIKERYNAKGEFIDRYAPSQTNPEEEFFEIVKAINAQEYCRMYGNFSVLEVPGNFHFDYRKKMTPYRRLNDEQIKKVSLDMTLNHLSFGMDTNHKTIYKKYGISNNFSPYDGISIREASASDRISIFIKIVPNYYFMKESAKTGMLAHQFSFIYQKKEVLPVDHYIQRMKWQPIEPASVRFNYEFSPITINYRLKNNSFAGFLVEVLAIVGGIFSIMGMINSFVLTKFKHLSH